MSSTALLSSIEIAKEVTSVVSIDLIISALNELEAPKAKSGITQEFKPAIFAKTYLDRIFADSGFTYNWPTLSNTKFDKLIIPYNGGIDNFDYLDYVVRAEKTIMIITKAKVKYSAGAPREGQYGPSINILVVFADGFAVVPGLDLGDGGQEGRVGLGLGVQAEQEQGDDAELLVEGHLQKMM